MQITKASANLTNKEVYKLTMSPAAKKMKEAIGQRLQFSGYVIYKDNDKKNPENIQTILAVHTPEGEVFATNSATFIEEFAKMVDFFESCGEPVNAFSVISGISKGGREFITCTLAD